MDSTTAPWLPTTAVMERIDGLIHHYRNDVRASLEPLVLKYYPGLAGTPASEYRKMIELSTKMTVVGHACAAVAGLPFDERRRTLSTLYGGCCFLADSFIDDFGIRATRQYLRRFEHLLSHGWFSVDNEREQLFYVILARLFSERDILDPTLRQAVMWLFLAQKRDVELRYPASPLQSLSRPDQLRLLAECARNRSGHAISVLAAFLAPDLSLDTRRWLFTAGALIMHIDDHGDCYADLRHRRVTYMNQLRAPGETLRRIFQNTVARMHAELPAGEGRDLLIGFLFRYYVTRLRKHVLERNRADEQWTVYE